MVKKSDYEIMAELVDALRNPDQYTQKQKWLRRGRWIGEQERGLLLLWKVIEEAEAIVYDAEHDHHLATNWATERLKRALNGLKG